MKKIYKLTVHGDSDITVNGEVFESERYLFSTFNRDRMVRLLEEFENSSIQPAFQRPISDVKDFRAALRNMKSFVYHDDGSQHEPFLGVEFGGNCYVRLEEDWIPTEEDFEN